MKIVHVCLGNFFIDGYAYQENLLTKYHKKLGHDVTVISSLKTFDENGEITYLNEASTYWNNDNIKIVRINYSNLFKFISKKLKYYHGFYNKLKEEEPDIIFVHNFQFIDIIKVIKYIKKNKDTKLFVDNHADFSNSAKNWVSRNILHYKIWKSFSKLLEPYTLKFYGVLPARVDFLEKVYGIPSNKTELLLMGADNDAINFNKKNEINNKIRNQYNIDEKDFLLITGGKIDFAKKQTIKLIKAVKKLDKNVKLIIFGSIIKELKESIMELIDDNQIQFIGWLDSDKVYDYFLAADLGVFPGRHSVLWEQAIATGLPCIFKEWSGTKHVDLGGNCKFIKNDEIDEIQKILNEVINNKNVYKNMKCVAEKKGIDTFSYSRIAKKSIST